MEARGCHRIKAHLRIIAQIMGNSPIEDLGGTLRIRPISHDSRHPTPQDDEGAVLAVIDKSAEEPESGFQATIVVQHASAAAIVLLF